MHLTPKQERFCLRYIETGNASEAYRQSYAAEKMKPETVHRTAKELLDNPKIAARMEQLTAAQQKRHEVTRDRVLKEFARLAFLDIRKAFTADGDLRPITELDDDTAAAVAGLEFQEVFEHDGESRKHVGRIHKLKLSDKKGALDSLARHLGMFASDKLDLTVRKKISEMTDAELAEYTAEYERATGAVLPRDPSGAATKGN